MRQARWKVVVVVVEASCCVRPCDVRQARWKVVVVVVEASDVLRR